jgi:hypothetical protein
MKPIDTHTSGSNAFGASNSPDIKATAIVEDIYEHIKARIRAEKDVQRWRKENKKKKRRKHWG